MLGGFALWLLFCGWSLLQARSELLDVRSELRTIRDDTDGAALLEETTTRRLDRLGERIAGARDRVRSPVLAPLRALPVLGRQLHSVDGLAGATEEVIDISSTTLRRVDETVSRADEPDTDRLAVVADLRDVAADARERLEGVDLGPRDALVGPLHDARRELALDLDELVGLVGDVERAADGVGGLLASDSCYLLLAANNAEMRAGSGMFLQAGELCFDGGDFSLGDLSSTGDLRLPDTAVPIADPDLAARWGLLLPNAEYRNLGVTPRFEATAELARSMWEASTGRQVGGVLAVDPVALAALLGSTGPITVDGVTYDADSVVDELLVEQYEGFLDEDFDAAERRDRLGEVAAAAVTSFESGGWDLATMVDELPEAVAGRHILGWSADPDIQAAFESMGMAGQLEDRSVAISILNRGGGTGGGKLDPFLETRARVRVDDRRAGQRAVSIEIRITNTVEEGTPTYVEFIDEEVRFGVYEGILAVNVPGAAGRARIEVDGEPVPLYAGGDDGPTKLVAANFELGPERSLTFVVRFDLPADLDTLHVEPSARVPATRWRWPGDDDRDETGFQVDL